MKPNTTSLCCLFSITTIVCGGCSTDSTSANPDTDWEIKEEVLDPEPETQPQPQPESEPEPEPEPEPVRIPVQTDGSEPEGLDFVYHPIEEAIEMPSWDENSELRYELAGRGRRITQTVRDPPGDPERRNDVWLGTKIPSFQNNSEPSKIHVFECIPEHTMGHHYYNLDGSLVFCNNEIIIITIRSSNTQGAQWFDGVSNSLIRNMAHGKLESFLQKGNLPTWEGVWFKTDESNKLSFQGHAVSNKNYAPYKSSDYPLVEMHIRTVVE